MMGPKTGQRSGSTANLGDVGQGFADMLASALRGGAKATLGLPGDIEGLGRMGLNYMGANVSPSTALRNTEDWDQALPPVRPDQPNMRSPYESIGEFAPLPTGAALGVKGSKAMANALRSAPTTAAATDTGRRAFMGQGAALAGAAAMPMGASKLAEALRAIPASPVAPVAAKVAPVAAKVAGRFSIPDLIAAFRPYMDMLPEEELAQILKAVPDGLEKLNKTVGDVPKEVLNQRMKEAMDISSSPFGDIWPKGYPKTTDGIEQASRDALMGKKVEMEELEGSGMNLKFDIDDSHWALKMLGYN